MGKLVGAVGIELLDNFKPAAYQKELESIIGANSPRSEEHTSELQSRLHLVCRLLLEKKKSYSCHARSPWVRRVRQFDECSNAHSSRSSHHAQRHDTSQPMWLRAYYRHETAEYTRSHT